MLSATETLSTSTVKRLVVEQDRFLKREQWVTTCKFQPNWKLQVSIYKLRVSNCELNLELQFTKRFAKSNLKTANCLKVKSFLWVECSNFKLLKRVIENYIAPIK